MEISLEQESWLVDLRGLIERNLDRVLPDVGESPHRLRAAMRYALLSPGKRIRPVLTLLIAEHLGCPLDRAMPAACALEMVHAASLVLDDLPCMDDAELRRGQPSVHARYGEDIAVLTGVALLNDAYAVLARARLPDEGARLRMIALLARTVGTNGLVGGQERDLRAPSDASRSAVSKVHHQKTGVLFVAAVEMGGLAAGADEATLECLRRFAGELGLAFQALDDLEDEADLSNARPSPMNMLNVLGKEGLRQEARARLQGAKLCLGDGGERLAAIGRYVDLLMPVRPRR